MPDAVVPDEPVTGFVASLGGKLAERWLTGLALPGVVFVVAVVVALRLGHADAWNLGLLTADVTRFIDSTAAREDTTVLVLALAVVTSSVTAAAIVQPLHRVVVRFWTGEWGKLGAPLIRRRGRRWAERTSRYEAALRRKARLLRASDAPPPELPDTAALAAARDRIALTEPRRPTWMGDRMLTAEARTYTAYGLDLGSAWPRLWLLLSDDERAPIAHAQAEFLSAARTGAWATLYLAVGVVWWPAALVGAGAWLVAWRRGRDTMDRLAELVEATVDLHATALARALGRTIEGEFTPADGEWVTRRVRKGA
ncbi:hypothetical protein [Saccharomonospora glauca]|uniref:hypothetical protein n=1 Tax=Saccharomonospora glauca TaxID=40990 RepID=UPI0018DEE4A4|nr:hypothetical protein [Saccharomonospora glauca]